MVIEIKLSRKKIYEYALVLNELFNEEDLLLPINISYAINKNKILFQRIAADVEFYREKVIKKYADITEDNQYSFTSKEIQEKAENELNKFIEEEELVKIYCVELNSFPDDSKLSLKQLSAIMFMIDETKEVTYHV